MNRWALAIAALLGGAVGLLHADYVVIKINLANAKEKQDEPDASTPAGAPGGSPIVGGYQAAPGLPGGGFTPPGLPGGARGPGFAPGVPGRFGAGAGVGSAGPRGPAYGSGPGYGGPAYGG